MDVTDRRAIDWERVEQMPEFRELVARRRRFVVPATVFFLVWYCGFIILAGYAEDFMGASIYEGFTVGYGLALTQFVMVAVLGLWYLRYSARELDPLRMRLSTEALSTAAAPSELEDRTYDRAGRFERPPPGPAESAGDQPAPQREAER
jgi:uncharacterized membrane protein (DUF485 family)